MFLLVLVFSHFPSFNVIFSELSLATTIMVFLVYVRSDHNHGHANCMYVFMYVCIIYLKSVKFTKIANYIYKIYNR